ncbi:alpha/beta fold hydrolase [Halieaceae bacterium IMCC14734]|uniref:Alpha/beta fold hydrolase n=1 Tax=Candidatus Litorirhabdus singularis TaxID=2518993 RepID=A0ABT3TGK2_9GAMM|nr:haloalkane dehalogenase [Candidatus Litorirhabdus singularis]MCX2981399.1 alpha/beta fold hydrolase [Candidatus Litorirhabdus singularis]
MSIQALRTPKERFSLLPAFPYEPNYTDSLPGYDSLRMAYIDEGDSTEEVFLCLHGEPAWSYLYRKMIPVFCSAGHRAVVPDLFGFGRSDKPVDDAVYTFDFHRDSLLRLIEQLDLTNITLVCQDWGGILGLTLPMDMPGRFKRLLVMNTAIPIGEPLSEGFARWKGFAARAPEIPISGMFASDALEAVNLMDALAYDAPFPDNRYKAGVRRFPQLVPVEPGMSGIEHGLRAREFWSKEWSGSSFMAIGMRDGVLGEGPMEALRGLIKNCPEPLKVPEAGHFVQEYGAAIAQRALEHFGISA